MEIKFPEKYARDVALEIEKRNWPHLIVKESPKYRHYKRLTTRYDAKWILDLHSNDAHYLMPKKTEYLAMLFCGTGKKQQWPKSFYILQNWKVKQFPNQNVDIDLAGRNRPKNLIGVELFSQNKYSDSIEFLKNLTQYLYLSSI
ncbi:MAG: hypothetical protein QXW91_00860 [Candidatus Nitrosotenuis sp.]